MASTASGAPSAAARLREPWLPRCPLPPQWGPEALGGQLGRRRSKAAGQASRGSEVQDTPNELSTHRLAKRRVLSGHSRHHGNVSPSESGKAADKPPTRVWDPFRYCLALDPVPVATQVNAVSPQNPKTQQHLLRLGPRARSCDLDAPFFPSSAHWGRAARLTLKAR